MVMMMMTSAISPKRVAIVGAGASGIPAAKEALDHGLEPVVFEESIDIGGLWRYKPYETEEGTVMKTTVINTSKEMTAYSTFPPPPQFAPFMHNKYMLDYLRIFADSFNFGAFLRLRHSVLDVRRAPSHEDDGKWILKYRKPDGTLEEEFFDAVLLCTGHHTRPYWPMPWPGQQHFKGKIMHAHSYKDAQTGGGFNDQIVVVVGVGNSGIDIAVELSRVAQQVYLVTRRGTWILHRNLDHSVPFDMALNTRWHHTLSSFAPKELSAWYFQRIFERRLDHEKFGLKPKHSILSAHLSVNDELPNRLCCGTVRVRPNIREFLADGKGLVFEDGTTIPHVDQLILATGYSFEFPLVENGHLIPVIENDVNLYKFIFPPELYKHNTLAVIGLIQPLGSIMPISEMQARFFFEALTGAIKLPDGEGMWADIERIKAEMQARYVQSRRHTIQVDYIPYMDDLAKMIGCLPQLDKYALSDPALFRALFFGPNAAYVYRLDGPGKWTAAREAILGVEQRTLTGMRGIEEMDLANGNLEMANGHYDQKMPKNGIANGSRTNGSGTANGHGISKNGHGPRKFNHPIGNAPTMPLMPLAIFLVSLVALLTTLWTMA